MTDIIAMHRADLVDAVTAAVTPIKAERDAIAAARQHEFAYIEKVLKACSNATASDMRDELRDLRAWATNRSTCFSVETSVNPTMQHAPDCPILHGKECQCDPYPLKDAT